PPSDLEQTSVPPAPVPRSWKYRCRCCSEAAPTWHCRPVACIARGDQRVVPSADEGGGIHAEDFAALGDVGHVIVRREVADRAGGSGRLIDVPVVEDELRSPHRGVVEIMLPAAADNRAVVVASEARLYRGDGTPRAVKTVVEEGHRSAPRDACGFASLLERVLIVLVERQPDRKSRA